MNKYLAAMAEAQREVSESLRYDIEAFVTRISTPAEQYSFSFQGGQWDWKLNGAILKFSTMGYEKPQILTEAESSGRVKVEESEAMEEFDRAIVSLIKNYHFCGNFKDVSPKV